MTHSNQSVVDRFAGAVQPVLTAAGVRYDRGPMGGHEWRWSNPAGAWALTLGGAIDAGPLVMGPGGNRWHLAEYTLHHADLVVLMLRLAGALPAPPERPVPDTRMVASGPSARLAGTPADQAVLTAGSDIPARGGGIQERRPPLQPADVPLKKWCEIHQEWHMAPDQGDPVVDLDGVSERLYRERPVVMGGGGPAEYGSDGVAYEDDRIYPAPEERADTRE